MDENEIAGALAQIAPQSVDAAPMASSAQAVPQQAPAPQPSEYEKAIADLQKQRLELVNRHKQLIDSLETRVAGPQEMMFALSSGFLAPTRSGGFGEALGRATQNLGQHYETQRQQMSDIAKMKLELQMQELGMAKENIELAKTQQLSSALTGLLSGRASPESAAAAGITREQASLVANMPAEYKAMIVAQLQTGDVKGAVQELQKYMLEQTKEPEKIKELRYYLSQLQSPAAKAIAQQLAANNYFLGSPAERNRVILDIRKAADAGEGITRKEADILIGGLTNIGGAPVAPTAAPSAALSAPAAAATPAGFPRISPEEQAERDRVAAGVRAREQTGAGIPTSTIVGTTSEISPKQKRELEVKRQEEVIARSGRESEETSKNVFTDFINTQNSAQGAFSRINSMDIYKNLGANAAAGGVQPVITGVKNILSSFGFTPESLVNEQVMSATIDNILTNYMKELGARGLTNTDMLTIKNSLPTLNTSKEARVAVANIIQKANQKIIDQYRVDRVNLSKNYPDRIRNLSVPNFYVEWIAQTKDVKDFVNRYKNAKTQEEKEKEKKQFDAYYGFGAANKFVGE